MTNTVEKKLRRARGIRQDRHGLEAYVKIQGHQFSKRFPRDTPFSQIQLWRAQKRAEGDGILKAAPQFVRALKKHTAPLPRSSNGWCYIYFALAGELVKIGRAIDPLERCRNMQTANGLTLELVCAVPAHASLEPAVHQRFAHLRQGGSEWFLLDDTLAAFIEELQTGINPVALLW
jgi:hypothetical protein